MPAGAAARGRLQKFEVVTQDTHVLIDAGGEVAYNGGLSGPELRDRAAELAGG